MRHIDRTGSIVKTNPDEEFPTDQKLDRTIWEATSIGPLVVVRFFTPNNPFIKEKPATDIILREESTYPNYPA